MLFDGILAIREGRRTGDMIDLHLHSQYSEDGEYSPEELVRQCYQKGVRILSITDHNCVRANEEALKAAFFAIYPAFYPIYIEK